MRLGLGEWFGNFAHFYDYNIHKKKQCFGNIPNPHLEYGIYCTIKCVQISSFISGCIIHPIYRYILIKKLTPETTTNNSRSVIRNICRRMQGRCLIGSLTLAPVVTAASIYFNNYSFEELQDKCYEIRCSDTIVYDRSSVLLGLMGWYWKRFQGAVDGVNLSIVYSIAYYGFLKKHTYELLSESVPPELRYSSCDEAKNDRAALLRFVNTGSRQEQS